MGYLKSKPSLQKNNSGIHSTGNNKVLAFPKSFSPKGNVIARLVFELAYYGVAVQYVSYNVTRTLPHFSCDLMNRRSTLDDKVFSHVSESRVFQYPGNVRLNSATRFLPRS